MTEDRTIPEDVFADGIDNLIKFTDQTLDFMFLPAAERLVRKSLIEMTLPGFGKCRWHAIELAGLCRRGRKSEKVEIRFNPYDAAQIYVLEPKTQKLICIAERWGDTDPTDKTAVVRKIRSQNSVSRYWCDAVKQLAMPETKIHRLSPYEGAAAEIVEIEKTREEIVVSTSDVNRKIINLSKELDRKAALEKAASHA